MPLGAFKAALMGTAGVSTETVVLLSTTTASDAATVSITSGIDSTYGEYIFKFYNMNPANDDVLFAVQFNASGQSGYNETITSSAIRVIHKEDDSSTTFQYHTTYDLDQQTLFQMLGHGIGNGADESWSGELHLFNPSSTTYVKHFYAHGIGYGATNYALETFVAGYINTTAAITDVQFKMTNASMIASGNMDGKIKMWGVK